VSSTDSIAAAIRGIVGWITSSGRPLAGVVTAAGIGIGGLAIGEDGQTLDLRNWDTVFGVNVRGSIDLATQLLPHWTQDRDAVEGNDDDERGVIIFVSSITAFEGVPGMTAYAASKAAIMAAALPLARELSVHRIRVVAIAPGAFDTPLFAKLPESVKAEDLRAIAFPRRFGDPGKDFAPLIVHVFENAYLNGTSLRLDGGERVPTRSVCARASRLTVSDRDAYAVAKRWGLRKISEAEGETYS
jgi:NAD(P)-dependent dehydrogenase (short-subunit alcohol dehydrogenase family)